MPTVLITGTSKGIGLATALAFARAGYQVHATMRNPEATPELAQMAARENLNIVITKLDVDSDQSVAQGIAAILQAGPLDVLVNNAGIERVGSVEDLPLADFRQVMETNYFGVIRCLQAVLPHMRQRRSGCIVNVASVSGHISIGPLAAYSASKFALEALSEALAGEMKSFGVHVAVVEPGIIDTAMAQRIGDPEAPSLYPQQLRIAAMFAATLQQPDPPSLVADKILDIVTSGTWELRHPVGATAIPFLGWRKQMSDEEWVALASSDDETWYQRIEHDFGIDTRPHSH